MTPPRSTRAIACALCAALLLAAAPAAARAAGDLDDVAELARTLPAAGDHAGEAALHVTVASDRTYRVEVPAAAGRYDRQAGVFHVRLLTADERIFAAMRIDRHGTYLARTRAELPFLVRREDVTIYELQPLHGSDLARDIAVPAPPGAARSLWDGGLVAVCTFRVVPGADGLPAERVVEARRTSIEAPLDGKVTTHVIRVALESVTLRPGSTDGRDLRIHEPPPRSPSPAVRAIWLE